LLSDSSLLLSLELLAYYEEEVTGFTSFLDGLLAAFLFRLHDGIESEEHEDELSLLVLRCFCFSCCLLAFATVFKILG
jgi:hypothetical protein